MTRLASAFLLFLTPWMRASVAEPPRPTAKELIAEGVRFHDEGRYDEAIERYK